MSTWSPSPAEIRIRELAAHRRGFTLTQEGLFMDDERIIITPEGRAAVAPPPLVMLQAKLHEAMAVLQDCQDIASTVTLDAWTCRCLRIASDHANLAKYGVEMAERESAFAEGRMPVLGKDAVEAV